MRGLAHLLSLFSSRHALPSHALTSLLNWPSAVCRLSSVTCRLSNSSYKYLLLAVMPSLILGHYASITLHEYLGFMHRSRRRRRRSRYDFPRFSFSRSCFSYREYLAFRHAWESQIYAREMLSSETRCLCF